MFREMRRATQRMPDAACVQLLRDRSHGVLAVAGEDGYPYAVPVSYVYMEGKIYIHCATEGHKLDAIRANEKVSFCAVERDDVVPAEFTTRYASAIAFGRARIVEEEALKRRALMEIGKKYAAGFEDHAAQEIDDSLDHTAIVEIEIDHLTGKESRALAVQRKAKQ